MILGPGERWPAEEFCGRCRLPIHRRLGVWWHPTEADCRRALMARVAELEREMVAREKV